MLGVKSDKMCAVTSLLLHDQNIFLQIDLVFFRKFSEGYDRVFVGYFGSQGPYVTGIVIASDKSFDNASSPNTYLSRNCLYDITTVLIDGKLEIIISI